MNAKQVIAAAALALIGSASFAQSEIELQHFGAGQKSTVSRAEVRSQVLRAQASGETVTTAEVTLAKIPATGLTRAEVRAATQQALADGSLARLGEVEVNEVPVTSVRSRAEVSAEARAATRSGQAARVQAGR